MSTLVFFIFFLVVLSSYGFAFKKAKSLATAGKGRLNSRPNYYGIYAALSSALPGLAVLVLWLVCSSFVIKHFVLDTMPSDFASSTGRSSAALFTEIENVASGSFGASLEVNAEITKAAEAYISLQSNISTYSSLLLIAASFIGFLFAFSKLHTEFRAREAVEKLFRIFLFSCSSIAVLTTLGIVFSLIFESLRFFQQVPLSEFLFGTKWSPQTAMHAEQVASSGAFGAVPLFLGTMLIAGIALLVAVPIGLMSAIYLSEYASKRFRAFAKPLLEILAGIPTVVYGFFAALTVAPFIRDVGTALGLDVSSESALGAGLVMGIMIVPFVSSLSDDVINAVPQSLRDGSLALGATKSETIKRVIMPAALPGVVGAILLATSRAIGETMIVVMAAGLAAKMTLNPLDNVTTVTVQIVTALVGDQEFGSPKTLSVFALGLVLFCVTLLLNVIALQVVKRYREKYE